MPEKQVTTSSTFSKDVLLTENIKREVKYYRISEEFSFTPKMEKNMVITKKPTGERADLDTARDVRLDAVDEVPLNNRLPKLKYAYPITTSQEIGWDTEPLVSIYGSRFNHPKVRTDATMFAQPKQESAEKKKKE